MSVKLYVGNLSVRVLDSHLEKLSGQVGTVKSVEIVKKAEVNLSEPWLKKLGLEPFEKLAVVRMGSRSDAIAAAKLLHGKKLFGRKLIVRMAGPHGPPIRP